jgi:hypothetical protein
LISPVDQVVAMPAPSLNKGVNTRKAKFIPRPLKNNRDGINAAEALFA